MPASTTTKAPSRRKERDLSEEERHDIKQKRLRGELSCAECRRLKLRCDKKVPCSSCVRRGAASICPLGILEAGAGTRFILGGTTQLHSKISSMSSRIRALEDALAISHSSMSSDRHPLLEDELLKIKFGSETLHDPGTDTSDSTRTESTGASGSTSDRLADTSSTTLDAFGTLTLGDEGEMKYFGRSAGSESLILAGEQYLGSGSDTEGDLDEEEDDQSVVDRSILSSPNTALPNHLSPFAVSSPSSTSSPAFSSEEDKDGLPSEVYAVALGAQEALSPLTVADLLRHLPLPFRAELLANSYIEHASLFFRAMKRDELLNSLLPSVYSSFAGDPTSNNPATNSEGLNSESDFTGSKPTYPSPHLLSTVFFVFALGTFFDLSSSVPKYVSESEMWFELGRKALTCSRGVVSKGTSPNTPSPGRLYSDDDIHLHDLPYSSGKDRIAPTFSAPASTAEDTIRALGLMATYCSMSGKKYARDSAWCGMSLAAKVAQGAGLHRDPARWHMDPNTVQRRRALWWEVCTADISHSVALGRPPSIHLSFVDCEYPTDEEATLSDAGEEVMGFWRMKYTFARESFTPVISTTLVARSPTYTAIMELDKKIRELALPAGFKPYVSLHEDGEAIYYNSHLALRDFYASQHRTVTMLYLHRSFFAHAMLTHPSNPLVSPFAPSFLAAYRAASVLIKAAVHFYDRCPAVVPRVWFLTYHVFSAAVTVGTVVKRSPNSSIAGSAMTDFGQALDLFEKCANSSSRNRIACALLRKLKEKADRAYKDFLASKNAAATPPTSESPDKLDTSLFTPSMPADEENELAMWGGQTRLLNGRTRSRRGKGQRRLSSGSGSVDSPVSPVSPSQTGAGTSPSTNISSEFSWTQAIDAQMDFDANLPPMDVSMAPPANFDAQFGSGTTGSRGLLMDMALEDIGVGVGSGSNPEAADSVSPSQTQSVLMEYLSGTEATSASSGITFPGPSSSPLSWLSGSNTPSTNTLSPYNQGMSAIQGLPDDWPNTGNDFSSITPSASVNTSASSTAAGSDMAELYSRFMDYIAQKQHPSSSSLESRLQQSQAYFGRPLGTAGLWPSSSLRTQSPQHSIIPSNWALPSQFVHPPTPNSQTLTSSNVSNVMRPSHEDYNMFFESLGLGSHANSSLNQEAWRSNVGNGSSMAAPVTEAGMDVAWATFMQELGSMQPPTT